MFDSNLLPEWLVFSINLCGSIADVQATVWPPIGVVTFKFWDLPILSGGLFFCSCCLFCLANYYTYKKDNPKFFAIFTVASILLALMFVGDQVYTYLGAEFTFTGPIYSANYFHAAGQHIRHIFLGLIILVLCLVIGLKWYQRYIHFILMNAANLYWVLLFFGWLYLSYAAFSCV